MSSSFSCFLSIVAILCVVHSSAKIVDVVLRLNTLEHHHTEKYDIAKAIVLRRGFPITFNVILDSPLVDSQTIEVKADKDLRLNSTILSNENGLSPVVEVLTPHNAPIEIVHFNFSVQPAAWAPFVFPYCIYLLFNPYNPQDTDVYMEDKTQLTEYIENEYGNVYRGSLKQHSSMRWYYAQFHNATLITAFHLLKSFDGDKSDPRLVSRHLTYAATYQQRNRKGVLVGNWGGDYSGGKPPFWWQGSDDIFDQYVSTEFSPVKYGQCWVFGGILNSLLRAIGIPSRQLTTFDSAHESPNENGTYIHEIGMYYNSYGRLVKRIGSIWNFHSWNDAWMSRPDLGSATPSWQAVDATPQELSEDVFQMGPASLDAVRKMDDSREYDTPFVISEVSSKVHSYIVDCSSGSCRILKDLGIDTEARVGSLVVTSPLQGDDELAITDQYRAVHRRLPKLKARRAKLERGLVDFSGGISLSNPDGFGNDIIVDVELFSGETSEVYFEVQGFYVEYNGRIVSSFYNFSDFVDLTKENGYKVSYALKVREYLYQTPVETNMFFTLYAIANSTEDTVADQDVITVQAPPLLFQIQNTNISVSGRPVEFSVYYNNPLPRDLTNVSVRLRAIGMNIDEFLTLETVKANSKMTIERQLSPPASAIGRQTIVATMFTSELNFVYGYQSVTVIP